MSKILMLLTAPIRYPLKLAVLAAVGLAGAVALGDYVQPVRAVVSKGVHWVIPSTRSDFDPSIAESPVKELEYLQGLDSDLKPSLVRARTLIRQRRAEIEFTREQARFCEQQLSCEELTALRSLVTKPETTSQNTAKLAAAAQGWVAAHARIERLQEELNRLLQLDQRVVMLLDRMNKRRQETQGLVPTASTTPDLLAGAAHKTPEISEAEQLLAGVHERLFKALYTISPTLVAD